MSGPALLGIVVAAIILVPFALKLWYADLSSDDGRPRDRLYDGEARLGYRISRRLPYSLAGTTSGFLPVEIRGSTVRLGASTGILRWGAASLGLYHRLDASQFEAVREWIARPPNSLVRRSGEAVLLRGMNHRGRYVEFTLMPRDGDVPRLITALERAGARAHRPDGTAPTI
jgi:hypothetical protein